MNRYFLILFVCFQNLFAQDLVINENGLIYDTETMSQLSIIVDSLNLQFKTCESKQYYAIPQAQGHYVIWKGTRDEMEEIIELLKKATPYVRFR